MRQANSASSSRLRKANIGLEQEGLFTEQSKPVQDRI